MLQAVLLGLTALNTILLIAVLVKLSKKSPDVTTSQSDDETDPTPGDFPPPKP